MLGLHPASDGFRRLAASEQAEEKSAAAVQNSLNAVAQALEEGMVIQKLHLVATSDADPDRHWSSRWMPGWLCLA